MPDIAFWNKCDNKCVMCTNMKGFAAQDSSQYRLKGQMLKMESYLRGTGTYSKNAGKSGYLSLTGGEPTLHPEFFKLLAYFRRRLEKTPINLLTNGRKLSDTEFTARLLKIARPPFGFIIPVHGPNARLHDRVTGVKGSFAQTMKGLDNLFAARPAARVELRVVLHRLNVSALPGILKMLLEKFPDTARYRLVAVHYEIEGQSLANHRRLALRLGDSARALRACLGLARQFRNFELYHFPLCVLPAALRPKARITLPPAEREYPPLKCGRCALREKCLGLMAEYRKKFGDGELRPRPAAGARR